ncbi:hypothetical protein ACFCV9_40325 [Streptomyces sp. NPDC056367]|uniref:hypothetical protein n=1 Tax=Streptomyces sp. NPDC056367 TaxID=3345797 RepID=UPI0035D6E491
MSTREELNEAPDDTAALLVRDAMDRTTADLPPLPDLTGPARAQGRRRKARVRFAIGGGALAVAALGVAVAALPADTSGRQVSGRINVAAPPSTTAPQPQPPVPVHIEPSPGEESMADLPPAERAKQEDFQNRAVPVLQRLLPQTVGTVQRTDLNVRMYQAKKDGKTFVIIFSVRPAGQWTGAKPCLQQVKGMVCTNATLPGGIEAKASTMPMDNGGVTGTELSFHYGRSDVRLTVTPHTESNTSAPVTNDQLLELAKDPVFLDLVKAADTDPVEKEQQTIPGG